MTVSFIDNFLTSELRRRLGLHMLSEDEYQYYVQAMEDVILEAAVLRYVQTVSNESQVALQNWLETQTHDHKLFARILETFPQFAEILQREAKRFLLSDPALVKGY